MTNPIHCSSSSATLNPKERIRRNNEMKQLLSTLNSLVSNQTSKEGETMEDHDVLENATNCIKNLEEKVKKLKEKKEKLKSKSKGIKNCSKLETKARSPLLISVEARQVDSLMEVLLTTGFDDHFVFPQILKMLLENGAEVVSVNKFRLSDRFFHKIIATQVVGEGMAAGGSDFERIRETLKKFVSQYKDLGQYNV